MEALIKLGDKVKVMVCGPGRSLDREGGPGVHMQREVQMKLNMIWMNVILVVSADAVDVDHCGRNKPVQRAWILLPAYLAAVPDFFSLTRTDWPGETGMKIRDAILKEAKESTSSKMGGAGSMSESEDPEMPNVGSEIPPIGGAPESSSSGVDRREANATAAQGVSRKKKWERCDRSLRRTLHGSRGSLPHQCLEAKLEIGGLLICGRPGQQLRRRTLRLEVPLTSTTSSPIGERPVFRRTLFLMVRVRPKGVRRGC